MSDRGVSRTANDSEENQIDLTPMLDVVFIMLIFFIVTSSFVKEPGVELLKPQAVTTEQCTRGTIIFAVDDRGDIHYNKNKIPLERAAFLAEAAKKEAPQAELVIQVDQKSDSSRVLELSRELMETMGTLPCISTDEE
ncbi:ExbD/TolR family protein [Halioglobus pacificus]|uniref:Biopolymer transporter ExbD n=1 Tax=Parahalioglobus pacificus TaxID=930806 RepID=A0A919CM83_9GAMM|nr:biopolymer transporter ExbD [Halioglobus pacificus]NQY04465.1 biopolymer transporter ExbD [Halieaceae bacterium]GHD35393.1 biopolymer transporter ExbD [Halioglobus pacificus]